MSKSVLVIDTPGSCMGCNFFFCDEDTNMDSCMARETARSVDLEKYDKPDLCPLKPLPEKSTTENDMTDYQCGMVDGRNQCIDEITGGGTDD